MSHFGNFEHHFQIFVEDYIPNIWVMSTWDIYQPPNNMGVSIHISIYLNLWFPASHI